MSFTKTDLLFPRMGLLFPSTEEGDEYRIFNLINLMTAFNTNWLPEYLAEKLTRRGLATAVRRDGDLIKVAFTDKAMDFVEREIALRSLLW